MRAALLGVRGSTSAPGPAFLRYGGHTSCLAVLADGADTPALLLDAGTGLRTLPALLAGAPFRGTIALTHLHWDHVQGLPFTPSVDHPEADVALLLPAQLGQDGRTLLAGSMSPPYFPIGPDGLRGRWRFCAIEPGEYACGSLRLTAAEVSHKGGRTYGYRVDDGRSSLVYLPDHAPAAGVGESARALLSGVDVLFHDAQFTAGEREQAAAYGHATVEDALELAGRFGVGRLVLIHHAPDRKDGEIDALVAAARQRMPVIAGAEGDIIDIAGQPGHAGKAEVKPI